MKRILYLVLKSNPGKTDEVLRNHGHKLVVTSVCADALEMLSQNFDAMVIEDEDENSQVLDFTVQAHRLRPELPMFLTSDWGAELPMALASVGEMGEFGQITFSDRVWSIFDGFPESQSLFAIQLQSC